MHVHSLFPKRIQIENINPMLAHPFSNNQILGQRGQYNLKEDCFKPHQGLQFGPKQLIS